MSIELFHQDSRELKYTDDEYGDFTITSPPYYDIEDYGDEAEQLGKAKTYTQFLEGMQDVLCENFRVLKPGAFCIYFINDFRRKGTFHTYYSDIIDMMRAARFTVHDVLVVDMGFPMTAAFASQIVERKILPKRHEYGIIAVKKGD